MELKKYKDFLLIDRFFVHFVSIHICFGGEGWFLSLFLPGLLFVYKWHFCVLRAAKNSPGGGKGKSGQPRPFRFTPDTNTEGKLKNWLADSVISWIQNLTGKSEFFASGFLEWNEI